MTWFGWCALGIVLLAFYGNWAQLRSIRTVNEIDGIKVTTKVKKTLNAGILTGLVLNVLFLLGILFVGTGSLF